MGRRKLNLAGLAPRVLAANAGSGSGAAVSITGSGGGPPPGRGALHASQWRALATLFNVHFEQAQGMCWPCFFAASCALNVIGIAVQRVPASERDFRELWPRPHLASAQLSERGKTSATLCKASANFVQHLSTRVHCERAVIGSVEFPVLEPKSARRRIDRAVTSAVQSNAELRRGSRSVAQAARDGARRPTPHSAEPDSGALLGRLGCRKYVLGR